MSVHVSTFLSLPQRPRPVFHQSDRASRNVRSSLKCLLLGFSHTPDTSDSVRSGKSESVLNFIDTHEAALYLTFITYTGARQTSKTSDSVQRTPSRNCAVVQTRPIRQRRAMMVSRCRDLIGTQNKAYGVDVKDVIIPNRIGSSVRSSRAIPRREAPSASPIIW
jgi:hypothetical protein